MSRYMMVASSSWGSIHKKKVKDYSNLERERRRFYNDIVENNLKNHGSIPSSIMMVVLPKEEADRLFEEMKEEMKEVINDVHGLRDD
ncbi:MAG: hypothetical protein ACLFVB_10295 [Thermoplasmata archaeon]